MCETNREAATLLGVNATRAEPSATDGAAAPDQPSDESLLSSAVAGDTHAFTQLYDRHVRPVYRLALSLGVSVGVAEEVTQDTFVLVHRKARTIRFVGGSALPWLLTTSRNLARNALRKEQRERRATTELADGLDPPAPEVRQRHELEEAVRSAIAELPEIDQQLVELCLEKGYRYDVVAEALQISHGTVRNRLSRLRLRLRAKLNLVKEVRP